MKVAIITEDAGQFRAFPRLYGQLNAAAQESQLLRPLKVSVSPEAPVEAIANACAPKIVIARQLNARVIVLLLDRERRAECSGLLAVRLTDGIRRRIDLSGLALHVVMKDRTFENWLIADVNALEAQPARFNVTPAIRQAVSSHNADGRDALALLKAAAIRRAYDKVEDADRICARQDIMRVGAGSRSFRHLLHVLGVAPYRDQCRSPSRSTS